VREDVAQLIGWIGRRPWSDQHGYDPVKDEIVATIRDRRPRFVLHSRLRRLKGALGDGGYEAVREFAGSRKDLVLRGDLFIYGEHNASDRLVGLVFRRRQAG